MLERSSPRDGCVMVTFRIPDLSGARRAVVVGDFNDWSEDATPMKHTEDGFEVTVPLQPGAAYRFRYLMDGTRWENDWQADRYVDNDFGGHDSVIDLT